MFLYVFRKLYGINLGTGTCNLLDDNVNILACVCELNDI